MSLIQVVDNDTALKKHGKAEEDVRYQGTILGRDTEVQPVTVTGGPATSLSNFLEQFKSRTTGTPADGEGADEDEGASPATSALSSAPPSPTAAIQVSGDAKTPMSQG